MLSAVILRGDIIRAMSIRLAKQLIYGTFYVVLWVLVIWGGYRLFFYHPAPLPTPSPSSLAQPISVLGVNTFASTPGDETFLAKIANPNANLAAQYFTFSFDLRDASGTVIESFPGASFLYGSEVKYVALVNQPVANGAASGDASAVWTLEIPTSTTQWVATSSFGPAPDFAIQNISTTVGSSTSAGGGTGGTGLAIATGQLANNDTATFNNIFIVAIFKDANGNPIGVSQTELDSIAPDQTENFSVSYPAIAGINPAATEVEAYAER